MSTKSFQIPVTAINDSHVQSSMSMIMAAARLAERGCAALLGCGQGTEIPLRHLASKFDRLDCVDIDAHALGVLEARSSAWEDARSRCSFHHSDLTGLIPNIVAQACQKLAECSDPVTGLNQLCPLLDLAQPKFWRPASGETYSLVICSAVLTQLQASVRKGLEVVFLSKFPTQSALLLSHEPWRTSVWRFARAIEDAFIRHLALLSSRRGMVYLSDTVQMCSLRQAGPDLFATEGSWTATRTERLTDYVNSGDEILAHDQWDWLKLEPEGPFLGRLYGVQAVIYRVESPDQVPCNSSHC